LRKIVIPIIFLIAAQAALAWSPTTHEHICKTVVTNVWGVDAYNRCLENVSFYQLAEYCRWLPQEHQLDCLYNLESPHPASMPMILFNDSGLRENYETCFANPPPTKRDYICGDGINYASQAGGAWLELADKSPSECEQIFLFCMASNYLASQFDPLSTVQYETDKCRDDFEKKVDARILSGSESWTVSSPCRFEYRVAVAGGTNPASYTQTITITEKTVLKAVENLTQVASSLSNVTTPSIPVFEGVLKRCEYTYGKEVCGDCYCLDVSGQCMPLEFSQIGGLNDYVGEPVILGAEKDYFSISACPKELKAYTIVYATTTTTTLPPTTTTLPPTTTTSTTLVSQEGGGFGFALIFVGVLLMLSLAVAIAYISGKPTSVKHNYGGSTRLGSASKTVEKKGRARNAREGREKPSLRSK